MNLFIYFCAICTFTYWTVWCQTMWTLANCLKHFKSRLSLIVRVNVVLNRTVVVDSDWRFDNLCGSHHLYHVSWWYYTRVIDLIGQLRRDVIGRLSLFSKKCGFKYMPVSQRFLYLQQNKWHFIQVPSLFIWYAKNHTNRFHSEKRKSKT